MIPRNLPLFPLPLVLIPGQSLPLHVFEPRYRAMIAYAEEHGEHIGMATLLRPEDAALEVAEVFPVMGVGRILGTQPLDDGRCNVLLRFVGRARIDSEELVDGGFRLAEATELPPIDGPLPQAPWIRALLTQLAAGSENAQKNFARLAAREDADMLRVLADLLLTAPRDRIAFLTAESQGERGELVQRRMAERVAATMQPAGEA